MTGKPKNILLTGARSTIALELARHFHAKGHKVFVSDCNHFHICRFSKAVEKTLTTPSPRYHPEEFLSKLIEFVKEYNIDLLIPTCEEIMYISQGLDQFPKSCNVFCSPFDKIHVLHSKWLFCEKAKSLGLTVPDTRLIKSQEDLDNLDISPPFVLKASYSRACQNCFFVTSRENIPQVHYDSYNPWIAQKMIEGKKYCTYSIVHHGKIHAHVIYPVRFTVDGSSCITFKEIKHDKIFEWVQRFVEATQFTGQIAFDFIEDKDGVLYSIECNPRATHGVHLFSLENNLSDAFFGTNETMITPKLGTKKQLAAGMAVFGWRSINRKPDLPPFCKEFMHVPDVVYSKHDPKPFISMTFLLPMYWVTSKKYGITIAEAFTHDMDWNGDRLVLSEVKPTKNKEKQ